MNQAHFATAFSFSGKPGDSNASSTSSAGPGLVGRSAPIRVAASVSGRQATPASTPVTSGRAGSTGRVVAKAAPVPRTVDAKAWSRGATFPTGTGRPVIASAAPTTSASGPSLQIPSAQSAGTSCASRDARDSRDAREDLQPVRRARSAGRTGAGPENKAVTAAAEFRRSSDQVSAPRRDSPRNCSPQGGKLRRASPVRKGSREQSRSPEPPRARPAAAHAQVTEPDAGSSARSTQPDRSTQPEQALSPEPSFVQSLARLALALEKSGNSSTGAAAAAAAVAAAVAKPGDAEGIGDLTPYFQAEQPLQISGSEEALRARCARLEHEVAELRAQLARRLDHAMLELAASRQTAENANAQVAALRAELASGREVKHNGSIEARHWPQQLSDLI
ncbi:unnamed protein product [Effrenium voratum]|nr:unnamed protein product [Effrenium voratum]